MKSRHRIAIGLVVLASWGSIAESWDSGERAQPALKLLYREQAASIDKFGAERSPKA